MNKKTTDIVAYLTPLGFILAFLVGTKTESRFHLNQALVLILAEVLVEIVDAILEHIPLVNVVASILLAIVAIGLFVLWIMGLVSAIKGEEKPVPVLGEIQLLK